ncbi:hypothetical protein [Gillisia sp. JM1]|uniref:hypothetical protein n=1 Tax=Gillisia sp. JM1 TaxID=1283286 RepID=UPI00047C3D8D|nr:hypothetical protein [Gillisia sp. JM1]
MEERIKKAFDFAADATKQLITLSTAIIALTITFSKDIIGAANIGNSSSIFTAWILLIVSVIFGILTLLALTGNLQPMKKNDAEVENNNVRPVDINNNNIRLFSGIQILTFIAALFFTVYFGYSSIEERNEENNPAKIEKNQCLEIIKTTEYKIENPKSTDTIFI